MISISNSKRLEWLDMAKGYGIIAVVIAHLGIPYIETWIYTFHIPLFFFLSGYVFKSDLSFKKFIKKRIKGLIIPYLGLGIPIVLFEVLTQCYGKKSLLEGSIQKILQLILQQRSWSLWYITCLFCLNIIFYIAIKYVRNEKVIIIMSFVICILGLIYYRCGGEALLWNIDVCSTVAPFFLAGFILKKNDYYFNRFVNNVGNLKMILIFLFINILFGWSSYYLVGELNIFYNIYVFEILTYIAAFSGIFFVITISRLRTVHSILYIGKNSLVYFGWHQAIMMPLIYKIYEIMKVFQGTSNIELIIRTIITLPIIMIILTCVNWGISNSKLRIIVGH